MTKLGDWPRGGSVIPTPGAADQVGLHATGVHPEFIKMLSNATAGRWSPSESDLVNIERQTRTVTDIEMVACAAALGVQIADLLNGS